MKKEKNTELLESFEKIKYTIAELRLDDNCRVIIKAYIDIAIMYLLKGNHIKLKAELKEYTGFIYGLLFAHKIDGTTYKDLMIDFDEL